MIQAVTEEDDPEEDLGPNEDENQDPEENPELQEEHSCPQEENQDTLDGERSSGFSRGLSQEELVDRREERKLRLELAK
ncbi:hypothetical protein NDU88_001551 [Pleurodeles waltl]|uniref:Uncharacterized protein n=1 Tax=Pleurodeles waltl TaxID=8319 RepID=A0AAV7VAL6_PLEWA|nr:hypothetical protein NDU88_001551 [Pleurodeles waltl]